MEFALNSRLVVAAILTLLGVLPVYAQPTANPAVWQGGYAPTVLVNNGTLSDPYATINSPTTIPRLGDGLILPTSWSLQDRFWYRIEYLRWQTEGMDVPVLATTSPIGTAQNQAGVLGEPDTRVLFGGGEINGSSVNGWRTGGGFWFREGRWAIESEFFGLERQDDRFAGAGDGSTILARPFFSTNIGNQSSQLISYPNVVSGNLRIFSDTKLRSFMINARAALMPGHAPPCDPCAPVSQRDRLDWLAGFRYVKLEDRLTFGSNLTSLVPTAPGSIVLSEGFETRNEFSGLQLGFVHQMNFRRVWLESLLRVAIGNNEQRVRIFGNSSITESGVTNNFRGGLLAQTTNIGVFRRDQFSMIPEVGLTLGFRATNRIHATIGYSVFYFPNVVRAGDQIDTSLNTNLFPPPLAPPSGAARPRFRFVETDYWAHGLNLGGELRF